MTQVLLCTESTESWEYGVSTERNSVTVERNMEELSWFLFEMLWLPAIFVMDTIFKSVKCSVPILG